MKPSVFLPEPIAEPGLALLQAQYDCIAPWSDARQAGSSTTGGEAGGQADAEAIVVRLFRVDAAVLNQMPKLRVIVKHGAGVDNIDCKAATERGIPVINTPHGVTSAVVEYTIALILALARRVPRAANAARSSEPYDRSELLGVELAGKLLAVVGYGRIGRGIARAAALGLGMRVGVHDPYLAESPAPSEFSFYADLDELLVQADVLTVHVPLTASTRHLIDARSIALLEPGCLVVNTARGGIIDELALARALVEYRVAGAALDVFETEPLPQQHPLREAPNLLMTPHVASSTIEALERTTIAAAEAVIGALSGATLTDVVNPDSLDNRASLRGR